MEAVSVCVSVFGRSAHCVAASFALRAGIRTDGDGGVSATRCFSYNFDVLLKCVFTILCVWLQR